MVFQTKKYFPRGWLVISGEKKTGNTPPRDGANVGSGVHPAVRTTLSSSWSPKIQHRLLGYPMHVSSCHDPLLASSIWTLVVRRSCPWRW